MKVLRLVIFASVIVGLLALFNWLTSKPPELVTIQVSGSATRAIVTFGTGGTTVQREVSLPWSKEIAVAPFSPVTVVAQSQGGDSSITCRILRGTRTIEEATSYGSYAIVTCSGIP